MFLRIFHAVGDSGRFLRILDGILGDIDDTLGFYEML